MLCKLCSHGHLNQDQDRSLWIEGARLLAYAQVVRKITQRWN